MEMLVLLTRRRERLTNSVGATADDVAAISERGPGRIPEDKSADGGRQNADWSVPMLYAYFAEREENTLWPGTLRMLLLSAYAPQKSKPTHAAAAIFPVRAERGGAAVCERGNGRRLIGRGAARIRSRDYSDPARKSRAAIVSGPTDRARRKNALPLA